MNSDEEIPIFVIDSHYGIKSDLIEMFFNKKVPVFVSAQSVIGSQNSTNWDSFSIALPNANTLDQLISSIGYAASYEKIKVVFNHDAASRIWILDWIASVSHELIAEVNARLQSTFNSASKLIFDHFIKGLCDVIKKHHPDEEARITNLAFLDGNNIAPEILLRIFSQTFLNELKNTYKLIQLNDTNNYTVYIQITSALGQTSMRAFSQTIDSIYSLVSNFCNNEQINFARNQRAIDFPSIAQHVKALIYSRMAVNLNSEQTLKKLFYICSWIAYVDYQTGRHIQSAEIINNIIKFIDLNVKVKNQILDNYYLLRIVNAKNYLRLQEYKRSLEELNFIIGNCSPQEIRAVAYCYRAKLYVETEQFELAKKDFESSFQLKKLNQDSGKPVNKRPLDFYDGLIIVNYGDYLIEIGQYHLAKKVFLHGRKLFLDCSSKYGYNDSDKRHTYVSSCDYKLGRAERILLNFNEAIVYFKRVIQDASSSLQQGTQLRRIAICKLELAKIKNVTDKGSFVTQSYDKLERFSCFIGNESRIMIERNLHLALSYIDRYMIKEAQRELFRTHQKFQTLALNRIPASELTDITAVDKNKLITEIFNKDTPYIRYHHSLLSRIMHYLGITFYKQGFLRNALICFREGMLINVARLKNVYPETSGVELLELQDTTVQQAFKVLINHPRTLMSLAEIGAIYYDLGRFDEA
ncbi:MAG: tetratricopeptide repeat protein, partial [Candidatus Babeliales bacterium]